METPGAALESLAGSRTPQVIGVRHHSPALAAAMPELLTAAAPEVLYIELPADFAPWLPHLADPGTRPPVALAGHGPQGLVFLPFAEFSPELVALRWAREAGVPVVAFDLPVGAASRRGAAPEPESGPKSESGSESGPGPESARAFPGAGPGASLERALRAHAGGRDEDDLWDRLVEAAAPGGTAEALRRAALLVGWALRRDAAAAGRLDPHDLRREAHMRRLLARRPGARATAVVGAFHGPALLPGAGSTGSAGSADEPEAASQSAAETVAEVTTSLVPYAYPLLDERSGYPAGIRDPEWQQGVVRAAGDPARLDDLLVRTAVRVCAAVRAAGHPSGPPDAREVVRHARDLATLRGLPAAGRGELIEAVQTVLTQGQLLGRGRVVAQALESVLVGTRHGRLAPGTPRSGLAPAVEALLAGLGLPEPGSPGRRELRLDPHRSPLDRRREVALRRLAACGVPYGTPVVPGESAGAAAGGSGGAPVGGSAGGAIGGAIGTRWSVEWTPATAAMLEAVAVHGTELPLATEGLLRQRARAEAREGGPTAAQTLAGLEAAALCGLPAQAAERLAEATRLLPSAATLPELLTGLALVDRLASGLLPGLPDDWERDALAAAASALSAAGIRALDGLAGSEDPADARALAELATRAAGGLRLSDALVRLAAEGTPLVRGAAGAARVLVGEVPAADFGTVLAARTDSATTPGLRADLAAFLTGALTAAGPLLEAGPLLAPLAERVESLPDRAFLTRLPALRQGFDALSPAARARLLETVRTSASPADFPAHRLSPETLGRHATADLAGQEALAARGLLGVLGLAIGGGRREEAEEAARGGSGAAGANPGGAGPGTTGSAGTSDSGAADSGAADSGCSDAAGATGAGGELPRAVSRLSPEGAARGGGLPGAVHLAGSHTSVAEPAPAARPLAAALPAPRAEPTDGPHPGAFTPEGRTPEGPAPEGPLAGKAGPAEPGPAEPATPPREEPRTHPAAVGRPLTVSTPDTARTATETAPPEGPAPHKPDPGEPSDDAGAVATPPRKEPRTHPAAVGRPLTVSTPDAARTATETAPPEGPAAHKPAPGEPSDDAGAVATPPREEPRTLAPDTRWQLLLGRTGGPGGAGGGRAGRIATALDELYGAGRGEGAAEGGGSGGGSAAPYPDVRRWAEELEALFGKGVREEVLAAAAAAGRLDAALELDPRTARPSVELLRTVLSYAGGLPEGQLARLRPLVARLVGELTRSLANRLRPALAGLTHPRPTRRPGGRLDLARTVRANLGTTRRDASGAVTVLPEHPVFRTRARKSAEWRIVLVVDVSGSMEASTIWAAVTAAVLAGVPALSTHFVAFSTEVLDLTDQVADPLSLLLEVRVGGGTDIARGLRHARTLVTVPSRTLVVLVSDFEEGGPVGPLLAEVRALVDAGCHVLGCASLDDAGRPRYSVGVAGQLVGAGMPVAALSPLELARWVGERVGGTAR